MRLARTLLACIILSACSWTRILPDTPPPAPLDTPHSCEAACVNLERLGCDSYTPECIDVCLNVISEPGISMHSECVSEAKTCAQSDAYFTWGELTEVMK